MIVRYKDFIAAMSHPAIPLMADVFEQPFQNPLSDAEHGLKRIWVAAVGHALP